ncbi:hypothetical protein BDW69DRAFT_165791 [Aspergillus filifer]
MISVRKSSSLLLVSATSRFSPPSRGGACGVITKCTARFTDSEHPAWFYSKPEMLNACQITALINSSPDITSQCPYPAFSSFQVYQRQLSHASSTRKDERVDRGTRS